MSDVGGDVTHDYVAKASSSAKGGLAVAALGLVPEITLEVAKLAACSAGAKLTQVLSYRLNGADIRALEQNPPDILLFAGGTDGGNTDYLLRNAQALARSSLRCARRLAARSPLNLPLVRSSRSAAATLASPRH